jgi:hypothetical protein
MTRGIQIVAALIIAVASATDVPAQTNRRAIAGTVFEEAAAVLPGAMVTVLAVGTNIERHTTTSVTGVYPVTNLEPVVTPWCRRRRAGVEVRCT